MSARDRYKHLAYLATGTARLATEFAEESRQALDEIDALLRELAPLREARAVIDASLARTEGLGP